MSGVEDRDSKKNKFWSRRLGMDGSSMPLAFDQNLFYGNTRVRFKINVLKISVACY